MPAFSPATALALALIIPSCAFTQTPLAPRSQSAIPAAPAFDVAAIHQHLSEPHEHNSIWSSPFDGHFKAENMNLIGLIHWAYDVPETRILGAAGWVHSTMFNIDATSDSSVDEQLRGLISDAGRRLKQKMVQALLADRFKLVMHTETRALPIYALEVAKGGPQLGATQIEGTTVNHGRGHIEVESANSAATFAEELSKEVGRDVIDRTGIEGRYKIALTWAPDDRTAAPDGSAASTDSGPSIFTALEEQLGLKLASDKGPVSVFVIDHAEMPSTN